ncbi:MAG: alpha/beta hydrolase [Oscillospiraceae bacterium]
MLTFDPKTKAITSNEGGYLNEGLPIRSTFVQLTPGFHFQRGVIYEPVVPCEKSQIGIIIIHSDNDYTTWDICGELAKRGYRAFGGQVSYENSTLDDKMLDIKRAVDFLYSYPGIKKVVLMGHSGGATLMTAYQHAAENGIKSFQGDEKLIKCSLKEELTPADGIMTLDSNWGNGSMTLFSVDPAVIEEGNGIKLDPELDIYSPANGFDPEGAHYTDEFLTKFFKAQAERNNAIVGRALERLHALESGKGNYVDDEPFIVTGGAQFGPCNKLFPQDLHIFAHTKDKHNLLHADGSVTNEIIRSVRRPHFTKTFTPMSVSCVITTVRRFLTERAVFANADYRLNADGAVGVDWFRTYDCPPANIRGIHAPLLCMGMTGGYEYLAAEEIYNNATSEDKTIAFVEGATHDFRVADDCEEFPGQFGDTKKTLYNYLDGWLSAAGRFID